MNDILKNKSGELTAMSIKVIISCILCALLMVFVYSTISNDYIPSVVDKENKIYMNQSNSILSNETILNETNHKAMTTRKLGD